MLIPGRGEHPGVYERFGLRLSADGYVVVAAAQNPADDLAALLATDAPGPVVLAGSDIGALYALTLATDPATVAAVIAAGTPTGPAIADVDWEHELGQRTACPTHLARLTADNHLGRGQLAVPISADLIDAARIARPRVSVLFIHGSADSVAPVAGIAELAASQPSALLAIVRDGRHDILNDVSHRTVAATIVQFLERIRAGTPIVDLETFGTWEA
jgi:pimeloyl-ACP methyl ester carboxylesterase